MQWSILFQNLDVLLQGLLVTIEVSALALALALSVGVLVGVLRVSPSRPLRLLGTVYVEFLRNVPLLVLIFFIFFALPSVDSRLRLSGFWSGVIGLGLYTGAYVAEVIRSGIGAVPRGQMEAGLASGLGYVQTMRLIVLPQAVRNTVPPLGNQTINLIKNSSLVATVSVFDILGTANLIGDRTFAYVEALIGAGVLYLVLTIPAAFVVNAMERRLRTAYR